MNIIKKCTLILSLLCFSIALDAQILVPKFDEPVKIASLSSDAEEVAPIPYLNGDKLYFVRTYVHGKAKERKKGQEIWSSERGGEGDWSNPSSVFGEANDRGNNGVIGSSEDGKKIYVFNSIQSRRKLARGIAFTERDENGEWTDLKKLKINNFDVGEGYYSFYITPSEDVLLISMAANDTTTKEDLFVSIKDENGWSKPTSLGSTINTNGMEISPYLTDDKKALYFSSDGHEGLGDADIFVSYRQGETWTDWTKPLNLGSPINSASFDAYFVIGNNEEIFFSSNRGLNYSDIYTTKIKAGNSVKTSLEVVSQFNYNSLPTENVHLEIYDSEGNLVDKVVTDSQGRFKYDKLNSDDNYIVKVAEEDLSEFPGGMIYVVDEEGNKTKRYVLKDNGVFAEDEIIIRNDEIIGDFTFKELPLKNAGILVIDDLGNVVDTIVTDENGRFVYTKLQADGNYTFKPMNMEGSDEDYLVMIDGEPKKEKVEGVYEYNNLPMSKAALVILDENGFPLDTFYTDKNGKFEYYKLKSDEKFSIKPMHVDDVLLENINLYITDNAGERIDGTATKVDKAFAFAPTKEATKEVAELTKKSTPITPARKVEKDIAKKEVVKEESKKVEKKESYKPVTAYSTSEDLIYFEFNKFFIKKEDKIKLYKAAAKMRKDKSLKVLLIGHTDNVGGEKVNQRFSEARAEAAKRFLEVNNIASDRISTTGKGQGEPIATNDTKAGRADNRRVEIKFN